MLLWVQMRHILKHLHWSYQPRDNNLFWVSCWNNFIIIFTPSLTLPIFYPKSYVFFSLREVMWRQDVIKDRYYFYLHKAVSISYVSFQYTFNKCVLSYRYVLFLKLFTNDMQRRCFEYDFLSLQKLITLILAKKSMLSINLTTEWSSYFHTIHHAAHGQKFSENLTWKFAVLLCPGGVLFRQEDTLR